jgi:hypothetical protein
MATANTYLRVTELDFGNIRNNLKTYLSSQTQFQDYNFEGSTMAVLLDVLAYNTHYNAYYLNMLANEMFLDTAQQRESVVSRAKELGYLPTSAVGATANVNLTFSGITSGTSQFTIPKNSTFTTTVDDVTYTYVTPQPYTVINDGGLYSKDITIKEGEPVTHRFTVSDLNPIRYILPNPNVDVSSITVRVQESSSDTTTTEYTRATNISAITSVDPIYFIEEVADQKYEIIFGSGALGKAVKNGNIVIVSYLVCNDEATNGASSFSVDTLNIGTSYSAVTLTTNSSATGGRVVEDIASVKFNAPRYYQTQNRAVIDNDYQRIILNENPDILSAVAFGGEQASPPVYGKVYIAVKPTGEEFATQNRKNQIRSSIIDRTPLGIDPVVIDPDYTYLIPQVTTYYNKSTTSLSDSAIAGLVRSTIATWAASNLDRFGNRLRYSRFVRALDNISGASILNNDATIKMQKRFVPNVNVAEKVELYYNNPIRPGTVISTQFTYGGFIAYLDDDEEGNINIYRFDSNRQKVNIVAEAGTIDYTNGVIEIEAFAPSAYADIEMKVTATPDRLDIIPVREQILVMNSSDAVITVVPEYS